MEEAQSIGYQSTSILREGYGVLPKLVMRDKNISIEAKAIYGYLITFAGNGSSCFPRTDMMQEELGISKDRFYKHIKKLKEAGYINVKARKNGNLKISNLYEIILDDRDREYISSLIKTESTVNSEVIKTRKSLKPGNPKNSEIPNFGSPENQDSNSNSLNSNSNNNNNSTDSLQSVIKSYRQNIAQKHILGGIEERALLELVELYSSEMVIEAIEIAVLNNKKNIKYIKGILKNKENNMKKNSDNNPLDGFKEI